MPLASAVTVSLLPLGSVMVMVALVWVKVKRVKCLWQYKKPWIKRVAQCLKCR